MGSADGGAELSVLGDMVFVRSPVLPYSCPVPPRLGSPRFQTAKPSMSETDLASYRALLQLPVGVLLIRRAWEAAGLEPVSASVMFDSICNRMRHSTFGKTVQEVQSQELGLLW